MKKVMKKFNRALSIMLVAAMVLTMAPQTAMPVLAAEGTVETDASVENGEAVVGETVEAPETEEIEEVADPSDEGNSDTEGDDISIDDPADEEAVVEEPSEDDVEEAEESTIDVMGDGDDPTPAETVTVSWEENKDVYTIIGEKTAEKGKDYTFSIKPNANYNITEVKYTVGNEGTAKPLTEKDNKYTIPASDINGNITITVTTEKKKYDLTVNFDDELVEVNAVKSGDATITLADGKAKITAGDALTFEAAGSAEDIAITKVSYKVGAGAETKLEAGEEGKYTVPGEEIDGDVTITITAEAVRTVTFTNVDGYTITGTYPVEGQSAPNSFNFPQEDEAEDAAWKLQVKEGTRVTFSVTPDEDHIITSVIKSAGEDDEDVTALTKDKSGKYSFRAYADATISYETDFAEAKSSVITFKLASGSPESAFMVVTLPKDVEDTEGIAAKYHDVDPGAKVVSLAHEEFIVCFVTYDHGYAVIEEGSDVPKVVGEGATLEPFTGEAEPDGIVGNPVSTTGQYKLTVKKGKPATVTVKTEIVGAAAETTFELKKDENAENIDLDNIEVKADDTEASKDANGKYTVPEGTKIVTLKLTVPFGVRPSVTSSDTDSPADISVVETKRDNSKKIATYTCSVTASTLAAENEILTVGEIADKKQITINSENATISASIDGMAQDIDEEDGLEVLRDTTVDFVVTPVEGYQNVSVTVNGKAQKLNKGAFSLKVTEDTRIHAVGTTASAYAAKLTDSEGVVPPANGKYNVSYDKAYTASVTSDGAPVVIDNVKITGLPNTVKATDIIKYKPGRTEIEIGLIKKQAELNNKTLTVELQIDDDYNNKLVTVAKYVLSVSKIIAAGDIKGLPTGTVNMPIDTTKTYTVTLSKGELDRLVKEAKLTSDNEDVATAEWLEVDGAATNTLCITAQQTPGEAVIKLSIGDNVEKSFTVRTANLIDGSTKAPTIALAGATDTDLKLTLGAKNIATPKTGKVYYEVKVTGPASAAENAANEEQTLYFEKAGDSQTETVKAMKDAVAGAGKKASYNVTVSLVHVKEEITDNTLNSNNILGARSNVATKNNLMTQDPSWETKLTLKKIGSATLYTTGTNGEAIAVATPVFNKKTTHAALDTSTLKDISAKTDAEALTLTYDDATGNIKAAVKAGTFVGKHTIQVSATAPQQESKNTMQASTATMVVTVVKGIESLKVEVPSTNLYKPYKKAATLKATVVYNNGGEQPKTKLVEWKVVKDKDGTPLEDDLITIKNNGTVTVSKDYILKGNESDKFYIQATVIADKKGNTIGNTGTKVYSDQITITNKPEALGTLAIVKEVTGSGNVTEYKVVVVPDADPKKAVDVEGTKLFDTKAVVFKSGVSVEKDATIAADQAISTSNLTLKSSGGKNVTVDAGGKITVNKPAKAKLTATANDGSKKKVELSLNVINDKVVNKTLGLRIYEAAYKSSTTDYTTWVDADWTKPLYDPDKNADKSNISVDASTVPVVALVVQQKGEDDENYTDVPYYANFTVSVKGGKIVEQWGQKVYVALNSSEVKVTLTDKTGTSTKTTEYVLKSSGASGKPTFKAQNKLRNWAIVKEQTANIEVTNLPQTVPSTGDVFAKVEVDWSAKNAKNQYDLIDFASWLENDYQVTINGGKGNFTLKFNGQDNDWITLKQKSYKVKVTLGTKSGDTFTAVTLPTVMTVSVDTAKKLTYKPVTSYTINTKDSTSVALTGSTNIKGVTMKVTYDATLLNANINGTENKFTTYFKVDDGKLMLNIPDGETRDNVIKFLTDRKNKDHLTGYLTYTAGIDETYYDLSTGTGTNTVKITVTVKDAAAIQYVADGEPEIAKKANASTTITLIEKKSKNAASIAYVILDDSKSAAADGWDAKLEEGGKVVLTRANVDKAVNKTYTVPLIVLPADSLYAAELQDETSDNAETVKKANQQVVKDKGVKVSISVKVVAYTSPLDTAEANLKKWLEDSAEADWLTKDLTKEALLQNAKTALEITDDSEIKLAYAMVNDSEYITITPPTSTDAGTVKGSFELTMGTEKKTVAIDLTIPKLPTPDPEPEPEPDPDSES